MLILLTTIASVQALQNRPTTSYQFRSPIPWNTSMPQLDDMNPPITLLSMVPRPLSYAGGEGANTEKVEGEELVDFRWCNMNFEDLADWAERRGPCRSPSLRIEMRECRLAGEYPAWTKTAGAKALWAGVAKAAANETNVRLILCFLGNLAAGHLLAEAGSVKRFVLEFDNVNATGLRIACKLMAKNQSTSILEELSLRWLQIQGEAGAYWLEKFLGFFNGKLRRLYLSGNKKLGDVGIYGVSRAMKKMKHLELVSLSDTALTDEGCFALAESLKKLTKQRRKLNPDAFFDIDLSRNRGVTGAGVCAILEACPVRRLDLRGCSMKDNGKNLPRAFEMQLPSLEYAALGDNYIGPFISAKICTVLFRSRKLKALDMSFNLMTPYEAAKYEARPKTAIAKLAGKVQSRLTGVIARPKIAKKSRDDAIFSAPSSKKRRKKSSSSSSWDDSFSSDDEEDDSQDDDDEDDESTTTDALVALAELLGAKKAAPKLELLRLIEAGVTAPHNRRFKRAIKLRRRRQPKAPTLDLDLRMNEDIDREPEDMDVEGPVAMVVQSDDDDDDDEC